MSPEEADGSKKPWERKLSFPNQQKQIVRNGTDSALYQPSYRVSH